MTLGDIFVMVWCEWSADVEAYRVPDVQGWFVLADALEQRGHRRLARRVSRAFKHHRQWIIAVAHARPRSSSWLTDARKDREEMVRLGRELADLTGRHPWRECKRRWGARTT